jgi:hypothetical protein
MSTYNNNEELIVYKYLNKYLEEIIKVHKKEMEYNNRSDRLINIVREESIIEILNKLEGK